MQLGMRRIVIVVGSACLVGGAFVAIACSSDSSSSGTLPTVDSGGDNNATPPPPPPPPPPGDDGGDGGIDCSNAPRIENNTNDFYCAFVGTGDGGVGFDGGKQEYCGPTQECCNPDGKWGDGGHFPSYCADIATKGTAAADTAACTTAGQGRTSDPFLWDGGSTWECADKNGCPSGNVCCMVPDTAKGAISFADLNKNRGKPLPPACGAKYAKNVLGTQCKAACGAGEFLLCGKTDTCTAGTCTPFSAFFRDLAYCK